MPTDSGARQIWLSQWPCCGPSCSCCSFPPRQLAGGDGTHQPQRSHRHHRGASRSSSLARRSDRPACGADHSNSCVLRTPMTSHLAMMGSSGPPSVSHRRALRREKQGCGAAQGATGSEETLMLQEAFEILRLMLAAEKKPTRCGRTSAATASLGLQLLNLRGSEVARARSGSSPGDL